LRSFDNLEKIFESDPEPKEPPKQPRNDIVTPNKLQLAQISISSKSKKSTKNDIINLLTVEGIIIR